MTVQDKEQVAALFVETFKREPLGEFCGVDPKEGANIAEISVRDPVSFVVEDTSLPPSHRIIAFRTSCLLDGDKIAINTRKAKEKGFSDPVQAVLNYMQELWFSKTTVLQINPSARVMKFIALGVDSKYEGMGLAKELLNAAMNKARELECDAVIVVASAFATQHLFQNRLGFEEIGRIRYADFTWSNNGVEKRPFEKLTQPEFLIVFEKKLQS
ncbi:hypothetical protein EDD11_008716 [Mortierella claussenii]|nr:hypothetical protein EDD11_008716 [Mortierella claussenii]